MNLSKQSSSISESDAALPASKATSWASPLRALAKGDAADESGRRLDVELRAFFAENCAAKIWRVAAELLEEEVVRCRIPS